MRFEELLHWNDGQFLQPHHFQYFQRQNMAFVQNSQSLSSPYPWGLIDIEVDNAGLAAGRVTVEHFSAILEDGTPLSMPGNCLLPPLDLTETLKGNPNEITVYLALPRWSEFEANLAAEGGLTEETATDRRLYTAQKKRLRDENTGDNEITIITRRLNARLSADPQDNKDSWIMPVLKLNVLSHDKTARALEINDKYFPPYIVLSASSSLYGILQGLLADLRRCRDKALDILTALNFKNDNLSGYNAYTVLRLKTLNVYEQRISSLLAVEKVSPYNMYLELSSLLSELMAYDPINSIRGIRRYDHIDSAPVFLEIIKDIRSFILKEGSADYIRLDFKPMEGDRYLHCPIKPEEVFRTESAYLALQSGGDKDAVVRAVEEGDTFKLINPQSKQLRIRGIKLSEELYPPRFLPVLPNTVWFKLDMEESRVWKEITDEGGMVIDYVAGIFPGLEISIYLTLGDKKQ
jgi:type VI secretion system ImpJ/VasE family protein